LHDSGGGLSMVCSWVV